MIAVISMALLFPNLDGGFCLACVLFGDKCVTKKKIKKLCTEAVKYWPEYEVRFS